MLLEALFFGLVIGLIKGGDLRGLGAIPFRYSELFICALVVRVAAQFGRAFAYISPFLLVFSYVLLIAGVLLNVHMREILIAGMGFALNLVAIAMNKGTMPVSATAIGPVGAARLLAAVEKGKELTHVAMESGTPVWFLCDIISLRLPYITYVISVGDILVSVAVFVLVLGYMRSPSIS